MEKWLADESVDFRIVAYLRKCGYSVAAVAELAPGLRDEDVLKLAYEMGAMLITEDKDFGELTYRLRKPNHGIVLIRMSGVPAADRMSAIGRLMEQHLRDLSGKFTVISQDKIRIKAPPPAPPRGLLPPQAGLMT
ncbi:MAG: DUF5615 family PIN-like protein [Bacteroidia bacterium]|nr:DUF5615 family PIN-like protein [Bacteroidia bacterium]